MDNTICECNPSNKDTSVIVDHVNLNITESNVKDIIGLLTNDDSSLKLGMITVDKKKGKKKKPRCAESGCNKKLSLIDLEKKCNCNMSFCMKHFQPFNHNCKFDNKTKIKNIIKENNPKCIHTKINRF
tara:strand:+ start:5249 stop:5632 length:384 start_codon:yes stop_codon:yes gene_type:complete